MTGMNKKSLQNDEAMVLSELEAAIPDWEQQNVDPEFMDWLHQQDPYSGMQRQQLLDNAFGDNDTERVVSFFKGYLAENGKAVGNPPEDKLQRLASPNKSRSAQPNAKEDKRFWSRGEVKQHYDRVASGRFKGKEKEQRAIELAIVQASKDGRIEI